MNCCKIQRAKQIFLHGILLLVIACIAPPLGATSRIGNAEVRDQEGVPCFTIAQKELDRAGVSPKVGTIAVYEETVSGPRDIWSLSPEAEESIYLTNDRCIPYSLQNAHKKGKPAPNLVPGKLYGVSIFTGHPTPTDPTFAYDAKFCIRVKNANKTVVQVFYDKGWSNTACRQ